MDAEDQKVTLTLITVEHCLSLPIPRHWKPDSTRIAGPEGMLDVRIFDGPGQIDEYSLEEYRGNLPAEAVVNLASLQGYPAIYSVCTLKACQMLSYIIQIAETVEVRAVYVFVPGRDALARQVHDAVLRCDRPATP